MKRLEGVHNKWLRNSLVTALGGFAVRSRDTRVLFCKDTFDYPDLEGHELLCNHLGKNDTLFASDFDKPLAITRTRRFLSLKIVSEN